MNLALNLGPTSLGQGEKSARLCKIAQQERDALIAVTPHEYCPQALLACFCSLAVAVASIVCLSEVHSVAHWELVQAFL